jgi:hypothetical protein
LELPDTIPLATPILPARELPNCSPKAARLKKSEFSCLTRLSTLNYQPSTCEMGGISSFSRITRHRF